MKPTEKLKSLKPQNLKSKKFKVLILKKDQIKVRLQMILELRKCTRNDQKEITNIEERRKRRKKWNNGKHCNPLISRKLEMLSFRFYEMNIIFTFIIEYSSLIVNVYIEMKIK